SSRSTLIRFRICRASAPGPRRQLLRRLRRPKANPVMRRRARSASRSIRLRSSLSRRLRPRPCGSIKRRAQPNLEGWKANNSRLRTERGNVLIMTACSILLLLGVMVLAIDLGYLLNGKAELQNALDAAALAAVTQTHVVIARPALPPPVPSYDQVQINLIQQTAQRFGRLNTVRLPPHDGSTAAESRAIELNVNDIDLSGRGNVPPVISVTTSVALPTLFAGVFGFQNIDVRATSTARLVPVNGGTGLISGGAVDVSAGGYGDMVSGCWRPLLIPDSYIDPNGIVRRPTVEVDFATGGLRIQPPPDGSFY